MKTIYRNIFQPFYYFILGLHIQSWVIYHFKLLALKRASPLAFRNFAPLLSQCSVIFLLGCFHLRIFFSHSPLTPISCQNPVPISAVWASSAAAKWQNPVTDDRNICVEEDDGAAMAEELCKKKSSLQRNSQNCWQHFK